jgi:Protein of unknown function (DUF3892)
MTKELNVNCIIKPHPLNAHEHITHIGNRENGWMLTRETAISRIDSGTEAYYTIDFTTGKRMYVGVVRGDGYKQPYLRTHADGKWNDNLLAQQQCDASCRLVA